MELYMLLTKARIHFDKAKIVNHVINNIENNSKNISSDDIFVAIKGEDIDGHEFIPEAIENHAKTIIYEDKYYNYQNFNNVNMIKVHDSKKVLAILINYFYNEPSKKINLVGVTGTNGKTTITSLIQQMYKLMDIKSSLIGTTGINLAGIDIVSDNTTPSTIVIGKVINDSINLGIKNLIMEVSSHAIKQQRVSQLDFNTVIFTNFTHDHLDYHKTFDDYFYSKGLLFASLGNYLNEKKVLLNGDDKYYKRFLRLTNVEHYTYGLDIENDFQARNIICDVDKIVFDFYSFNEFIGTVNTNNIFGFFNIYNLLAITTYFYINNYKMDLVFSCLSKLNGVVGRMEKVENEHGLNIFIDYAHTPDSVYRVLNEIKMISKKNIICIIGCGGDRDALKRPIIGKIATNLAGYVIFTSDNPRWEDAFQIISDIVRGACNNNYITIENRSLAIKYAVDISTNSDIVVILGKGHENYQTIKNEKKYFSDYEEVMNCIDLRYKSK